MALNASAATLKHIAPTPNIFDKVLPAITNLDVIGLTINAYLGREVDLTNIGRRSCIRSSL